MIALAILGDPESAELPKWQTDIDMTQSIFRGVLAENPLATRCADILDRILPLGRPGIPQQLDFDSLTRFDEMCEIPTWPSDITNMFGSFGSFGWPESGQGEGFF